MYKDAKFEHVGDIPAGELVMKLPGTEIKMLYKSGKAYINQNNDTGHLALAVRDFSVVEVGEAEGMFGHMGEQLREQLSVPKNKALIKKAYAKEDHHLFYSRDTSGVEILCMPGLSEDFNDDYENKVIGFYATGKQLPKAGEIYQFHHLVAVEDMELISDREMLEKEVLKLASKVNGVYDKTLEVMEDFGL